MQRRIIAILGPTASGKTALGVEIAKKLSAEGGGGEIISADSRQVFRKLDLGTGKDLEEYGKIKYHLIDICDAQEKFTLFEYLPLARKAIEDIFSRGKIPIVVGGTNLYVRALTEGFGLEQVKSEKLPVSAEARAEVGKEKSKKYTRDFLDKQKTKKLVEILDKINPEALNTIDQKNARRLIRAIEMAQEDLKPIKIKPDFEVLQIAIDIPRKKLYEKIDQRVESRFEQGMLNEVVELLESGVDKKWLLSLGLEYKIITNFVIQNEKLKIKKLNKNGHTIPPLKRSILKLEIKNSPEFKEMSQELKWKSHQYAKRQLSWLRNLAKPVWVTNGSEAIKKTRDFLTGK